MDEDTLLVAIIAGRANLLVMRALKLARHRRARTLAVTDATLSDVAEHSEMVLYYSSNGPSYIRSNAALMGVVQAPLSRRLRLRRGGPQGPHSRSS